MKSSHLQQMTDSTQPLEGIQILVVAPDYPYPANHGGRMDVWGRLSLLKELGATVDLLVTVKTQPDEESIETVKQVVRNQWILPRTKQLRDHTALAPFQLRSRRLLKIHPLDREYDVALLDGDYTLEVLGNADLKARRIILRVNNDESRYFLELGKAARTLVEKAYYKMESFKFGLLARTTVKNDTLELWFASKDERTAFVAQNPHMAARSQWVPPPMDLHREIPSGERSSPTVLFVGALFMPNNRQALDWYLNHVHPRVSTPGYRLVIAGNGGNADLTELRKEFAVADNITVVISPTDEQLNDLYAGSHVFINPMQRGAGITLKTIHAVIAGLPVVSTRLGAQGAGLEHGVHLVIADEAAAFADAVVESLAGGDRVAVRCRLAKQHVLKHFDHRRQLALLLSSSTSPTLASRRV